MAEAADELWESTGSLVQSAQEFLNGDYSGSGIVDATGNIDTVNDLVTENGFDTPTEFFAACSGEGTGQTT